MKTTAWILRVMADREAAQQVGATLLNKDPEFRAIPDLAQEWVG